MEKTELIAGLEALKEETGVLIVTVSAEFDCTNDEVAASHANADRIAALLDAAIEVIRNGK